MSAVFQLSRGVDFDRLYRRHAPSVYRYTLAVLGNSADAEDVTQQTFLRAYRSIEQGTKPRKAENWLLTIAHNELRRHFSNAQAKPVEVELDEQLGQEAPERSDPSLEDVLRALQQLSPTHRSALVMREFEGRPYAEIAERLGMTQSALEATIFRARRALAEHLEGELTCTEVEEALLRRIDGRLPRRVSRRLKAHLRECAACVRHADAQRRQRAALRGLSAVPVPASLYLFRPEPVAAAFGVAGAGATGVGTRLVAKAAAVGAAAAVAGGVGYGAGVRPPATNPPEQKAAGAAAVPGGPERTSIGAVATPISRVVWRAPVRARRTAGPAPARKKPKARPLPGVRVTHPDNESAKPKELEAASSVGPGKAIGKAAKPSRPAKNETPEQLPGGGSRKPAVAKAEPNARTELPQTARARRARDVAPQSGRGPRTEASVVPAPPPQTKPEDKAKK